MSAQVSPSYHSSPFGTFLAPPLPRCLSPLSSPHQHSLDDDDDDDQMMDTTTLQDDEDDDLTRDVDKSFNEAMSVSERPARAAAAPPIRPWPKPSGVGSRQLSAGFPSRQAPPMSKVMLSGHDETDGEDEHDDDENYSHADMEMSPTARKVPKRPLFSHANTTQSVLSGHSRVMQLSSRLGQIQKPSKPCDMTRQDRPQRTFGGETGRENVLHNHHQRDIQHLKPVPSWNATKDMYKAPLSAPIRNSFNVSLSSNTSPVEQESQQIRAPIFLGSGIRKTSSPGRLDDRPSPQRVYSVPTLDNEETVAIRLDARRSSKSFMDASMDVDSPSRQSLDSTRFGAGTPRTVTSSLAASPIESPGLGAYFGADASPLGFNASGFSQMQTGAERSPSVNDSGSSPASMADSPSIMRPAFQSRLFEKSYSVNSAAQGSTFGGSTSRLASNLASRRREPYNKRPLFMSSSTMLETGSKTALVDSKASGKEDEASRPTTTRPLVSARIPGPNSMRRAYSVCSQGPSLESHPDQESRAEDANSPSAVPTARVVSHFETSSSGLQSFHQLGRRGTPENSHSKALNKTSASPFAQAGLLGFGANEMEGKILPCHRVKEDGLVRISRETLRDLIEGKYTEKISRYHIVDCRFQYEYDGGHIDGALNISSNPEVESLLLQNGSGVHSNGKTLPKPTKSGETVDDLPAIIVFHCEFSNKRAPAFAKYFRSRDRALNHQDYPKVHFPELYILEGGYCDFFQTCKEKCNPPAYVAMDDPKHCERRDNQLHDFRKFTRTRSFTYGEHQPPVRPPQPCQPLAFGLNGAGAAAQNRRVASVKEEEDVSMGSPRPQQQQQQQPRFKKLVDWDSPGGSDDGSPCAKFLNPATRPEKSTEAAAAAPLFGSIKKRALGGRALGTAQGKRHFDRTMSYAGPVN